MPTDFASLRVHESCPRTANPYNSRFLACSQDKIKQCEYECAMEKESVIWQIIDSNKEAPPVFWPSWDGPHCFRTSKIIRGYRVCNSPIYIQPFAEDGLSDDRRTLFRLSRSLLLILRNSKAHDLKGLVHRHPQEQRPRYTNTS